MYVSPIPIRKNQVDCLFSLFAVPISDFLPQIVLYALVISVAPIDATRVKNMAAKTLARCSTCFLWPIT